MACPPTPFQIGIKFLLAPPGSSYFICLVLNCAWAWYIILNLTAARRSASISTLRLTWDVLFILSESFSSRTFSIRGALWSCSLTFRCGFNKGCWSDRFEKSGCSIRKSSPNSFNNTFCTPVPNEMTDWQVDKLVLNGPFKWAIKCISSCNHMCRPPSHLDPIKSWLLDFFFGPYTILQKVC